MNTRNADLTIVTPHLNQDELTELTSSILKEFDKSLSVRPPPDRFLPGLESLVIVVITAASTELMSRFIDRLLALWTKKSRSKSSEKPVIIIKTATMDFVVIRKSDIPDKNELLSNEILEVRLELRK